MASLFERADDELPLSFASTCICHLSFISLVLPADPQICHLISPVPAVTVTFILTRVTETETCLPLSSCHFRDAYKNSPSLRSLLEFSPL